MLALILQFHWYENINVCVWINISKLYVPEKNNKSKCANIHHEIKLCIIFLTNAIYYNFIMRFYRVVVRLIILIFPHTFKPPSCTIIYAKGRRIFLRVSFQHYWNNSGCYIGNNTTGHISDHDLILMNHLHLMLNFLNSS